MQSQSFSISVEFIEIQNFKVNLWKNQIISNLWIESLVQLKCDFLLIGMAKVSVSDNELSVLYALSISNDLSGVSTH